ncbi:ATP-binding cassette sub-family G member 5-like [Haliotis rufescens]|uniref:ATP-binding cassette sub-family G member 5-like n=1 Tax=Haliotis rufescens TaxID=6454 RepID=UPI00201E843A|nr:ATP-binding cassette sub-family G member 5-like [Haliotis rufescens]XP_048259639.1 ATP-binding cassette sub-family G member 5-like [Haliotis rufescens]XP_048259640.1 ATP-binding cassette sub-family G member 5-like [Haliotis rufescens]
MDFSTLTEVAGVVRPMSAMSWEVACESDRTSAGVVSVNDVSYTVTEWMGPWWKGMCFRQRRQRKVLKNISMLLESGKITAIIGSSGSGKTSLLDVISCRGEGEVSGETHFRNRKCTRSLMKTYASYVMQADRLLPNLTVRETLRYTAYLKLPGGTSKDDVEAKVQKVLMDMGLRKVADSRIGGAIIRGISGGEKRRVTIALQLLQDPEILLLDEPTTGLDSYTARYLVSNLADLAHRGKIVVLTIHQPRSDIFKLLDHVAILSLGELAYFGKVDDLVPYFTNLGYPCPKYANPLDEYIDKSSVDRRTPASEEFTYKRVRRIVNAYAESETFEEMRHNMTDSAARSAMVKSGYWRGHTGAGAMRVLRVLLNRMHTNLSRDRSSFMWRLTMLPNFVFFVVIFLGRLKYNQESVQDRTGLLYQCISVPPWVAIVNVVGLFPSIREVYYRESRDGLYSSFSFLIAYALHVLPFCIVSSALFATLIYWISGMNSDPVLFGEFLAVIFILHYGGELLTVSMMGLYFDPQLANNTTALICSASTVLASGFLRTLDNLPEPLKWLSWGTIQKYASEIFVANEFHKLNLTCDDSSKFVPCVFPNGDRYLSLFYPEALGHIQRNFGAIMGFLGGFFVLACVTYKVRGTPNLQ